MDAGNINPRLIQDLQQNQTQLIQALSRILGAKLGDQLVAKVSEVRVAPADAKAQLSQELSNQLAQLNQKSAAPAVKNLANQLIKQLALVQGPQLNLIQLSVKGQNLLSYSDVQLHPGQLVLIRIDKAQQLSLQGLIANTELPLEQLEAIIASGSKDLSKLAKLLQLTPLPGTVTKPSPSQTNTNHQILRQALAQLLPTKDSATDLIQTLPASLAQLQKLRPDQRQQWFSNQLQSALGRVAEQLRNPQQLSLPRGLAQALRDSGPFFEAKLMQQLSPPGDRSQLQTLPREGQADKPISMGTPGFGGGETNPLNKKAFAPLLEQATVLPKTKDVAGAVDTPAAKMRTGNTPPLDVRADLKGALLGLLAEVTKELGDATQTTGTNLINNYKGSSPTSPDFAKLISQLAAQGTPELSMKALRQQLMLLIQQHTLGSLAKIQLQQLHALNHLADQADNSASPSHSWQMELPVRIHQEVHPLQLHFHSQWVDEAEEKTKGETTNQRIRQWQVMLNFDLPDIGRLYTQIILAGENLSANFWAERDSTLEKARTKLADLQSQLEQQGLKINQLLCLPGTPTQPKISLGYSLVDIKT